MSLKWEGDSLIIKMDNCIVQGMNQTMAEAAIHAKQNHKPGAHFLGRFETQTGVLEGSIRPVVAARNVGFEFVGLWGSVDVDYALVLELGGVNMPAFPYLRPAADVIYPRLSANIRNCFEGRKSLVRGGKIIARPL